MAEDNNDTIIDGGATEQSDEPDEEPERNIVLPAQTSVLLQALRNIPAGWSLDSILMADFNGQETSYPSIEFVDSEEKAKFTVVPFFEPDAETPSDAFVGYVLVGYVTPQLDEVYDVGDVADNTVVVEDSNQENVIQLEFSVLGNIGEMTRVATDVMRRVNKQRE